MRLSTASLSAALAMAAAGAILAGCGSRAGADDGLSGTVRVDGSSTVFPLAEAVAEEFGRNVAPRARVVVGVSGTGGGFTRFARGETDVSTASRPIQQEEIEALAAGGIAFIELPIAFDGIALVTGRRNDWVDCLTVDELKRIWEPGSEVDSWADVREGFPDRPLRLYGPGTDSGTYDYFTQAIVGEEGASRTDFTASEDDNVLVQGVAGDPQALAYFGLAFYENNTARLKLLGLDDGIETNGAGCIEPTVETVRSGRYQPLARPEFIYVRQASLRDPTVRAFAEFFLTQADTLAREVGAVPLSAEAYRLGIEKLRRGITGTAFTDGRPAVGMGVDELLGISADEGADSTRTSPP